MEPLLLQTKFAPPVIRENRVVRRQLTERLNAGLRQEDGFARKLTLVSAPAGFGKTTMVAEWTGGLNQPTVWLALEETDNDPARFAAYLLGALQQIDPKIGVRTLEMLNSAIQGPAPKASSDSSPLLEMLFTPLINDLADLPETFILALEDYQAIQNPFVHRQVSFLVEHLPRQMHLVILTREDPLLPIARLRSQGQVCEIRQGDLLFTEGETAIFLQQIMGFELSPGAIHALHRRTEGWIAGLQLAALSMQERADLPEFIDTFTSSNRYILDYLFEEVYLHQTADTREFLTKTSIVQQLSPGLCDAILERKDSHEHLKALEHANLFIVPLEQARQEGEFGYWYRYHGLFKDLLSHQLRMQPEIDQAQLHQRAARWFETHGRLADAMQHALTGKDWENAEALLRRQVTLMMKHGEIVTLIDWFKRFPAEFIWNSPRLCIDFGWPLIFASEYEAAETHLKRAETLLPPHSPEHVEILTARAHLARSRGDVQQTIKYSQSALELLPENIPDVRAILSVNLGMAYWHIGQIEQAETRLNQAQHEAQASDNFYAWLTARVFLGRVWAVRGELHQAARIYNELLQQRRQAPVLAIALLDLGALHYEWNELPAAGEYLARGIAISEAVGNIEFQAAGYFLQARLSCAQGRWEAAYDYLQKAQDLANSPDAPPALRTRLAGCYVLTALAQGYLATAGEWAKQIEIDLDPHPFYRFLGLVQERLLIAQGRKDEATGRLAGKFRMAKEAGWTYGAITARICQALAAETPAAATAFLSEALQLSYPGEFLRTYVDAGPALAPALVETARNGIHPETIGQILAAIGAAYSNAGAHSLPGIAPAEPLSERELEVLCLAAAGLSNQAIGEALSVSLGTVKTHLHHVYGKLDVSSRLQAVARARELKLLE